MTVVVGQRYGYREKPSKIGSPLTPVLVLQKGPRHSWKVKIRWLGGPYEGLDQWVTAQRLVTPWEEAEAFLEDERRMAIVREKSASYAKTIRFEAASSALAAIPHNHFAEIDPFGHMEGALFIQDFDSAAAALSLDRSLLIQEPDSFVDRFGTYWAPFEAGERLAKSVCERYPTHVLNYIQREEEQCRQKLLEQTGGEGTAYYEYLSQRLADLQATHDLLRTWCGADAVERHEQSLAYKAEILRLRKLIEDVIEWLRWHGHPRKAEDLLADLNQQPRPSQQRRRRKNTQGPS